MTYQQVCPFLPLYVIVCLTRILKRWRAAKMVNMSIICMSSSEPTGAQEHFSFKS